MLNDKQIDSIRSYFKDKPVLRAYLFGSQARNSGTSTSDIDILVELDYSVPIGLEFFRMALDLEQRLKKQIDLISARALSTHIKESVDQDKVLIYER